MLALREFNFDNDFRYKNVLAKIEKEQTMSKNLIFNHFLLNINIYY